MLRGSDIRDIENLKDSDIQEIEAIADQVKTLFKSLPDGAMIREAEATLRQEIKNQAAIARAKCAEKKNEQDRPEQ